MQDGNVKFNARDFHTLSCYYQTVITIRDYLERMASEGVETVTVDMMAILAGCTDEVDELRKERKEATDDNK